MKIADAPLMDEDERLRRVTHIVVLMMENRSFDHMLGYLHGTRPAVDGIRGDEKNFDSRGNVFRARPMSAFAGALRNVLAVEEDPGHRASDVSQQLGDLRDPDTWSMGGFVRNYELREPGAALGAVMGHYEAAQVPTYDFLASEFAICDRWFCSVPSWTWPNRVFAFAGEADGIRGEGQPPLFNRESFFRLLDKNRVDWRFYSHDHTTLALVDGRYRVSRKFRSFEHHFAHDCREGLKPVTWIDPNMMVTSTLNANDDHPPTSIAKGQGLVQRIYESLCTTPHWATTLFLIVYDEHGGFYDHVSPVKIKGEWSGPRVPALVVSPLVDRGTVSHVQFDHASIARTIIGRFCPQSDLAELTVRTQDANHLGHVLSANPRPRPTVPFPGPPQPNPVAVALANPALTDLQRAKIAADFLLELERERNPGAPDLPVPELSDSERGIIAAEYLSQYVETESEPEEEPAS